MRVPSSTNRRSVNDSMAMTPMIDVVFLLLVFFVCASIGQVRELILSADLEAPGSSAKVVEPLEREIWDEEIWLRLQRIGKVTVIQLNHTDYTDFTLLSRQLKLIGSVSKTNPVILDIEDTVPLGDVIRTYDLCQQVGFESLSFAAKSADAT
ncbi:MAG: biopolymer transporter ExbD [Planctomycetota bacterium]|nr:biopolymer transporter ExbD [Planctomycetota bacterium]